MNYIATGGVIYIEENGIFKPVWVDEVNEKFVADRMLAAGQARDSESSSESESTSPPLSPANETIKAYRPKTIFGLPVIDLHEEDIEEDSEEPGWVYW